MSEITVTVWVHEPNKSEINAKRTARLSPMEDADVIQYFLPDGWYLSENQVGEPLLVNPDGKVADVIPIGNRMAAITDDGISWLSRTGTTTGRFIKEAREREGLSIRKLAARAGISINTLSLIEGGKSVPRADILRKIANALGYTMDELWPE